MLPRLAWYPWEPRFGFPVFSGMRTFVSFSIHPDYRPIDYAKLGRELATALGHGPRWTAAFLKNTAPILVFCRQDHLRFWLIITSRSGEYLGRVAVPGRYPPGGSIDVDVTEAVGRLGFPDGDYMAILVMSNGRHDGFRSSPGAYSMTYVGERTYSTYRTGGFTRVLNDPRKKSHYGFRGINPTVIADERFLSSLFLINHSSRPGYDRTVEPSAVLLRADGAMREAMFGSIPAFGGLERSLEDLFGPDVTDFLKPFGGRGTTIATCPGVTLASLHITRARDGSSFSIEHSRPTHTYLRGAMRLSQKLGQEALRPVQRVSPAP